MLIDHYYSSLHRARAVYGYGTLHADWSIDWKSACASSNSKLESL